MKPLSGLRILEFDGLGPVTFAGMVLADLGADILRLTRSAAAGAPAFSDVGGEILHRGRPAVAVNLKDPADVARVRTLVASADGLIEGFRPGVMERLGLGPEVCAADNPRLVFGRITGWGQTGPMARQVGHDLNYIALSGALSLMGEPGRPPRPPLNLVGDYGGGAMLLVTGVLAGLLEAKSTGRGRIVDAAMTDGSALLTALFHALQARGLWSETRGANLLDGGAPLRSMPDIQAADLPLLRLPRRAIRRRRRAGAAVLRRPAGRPRRAGGGRTAVRHDWLAGVAHPV